MAKGSKNGKLDRCSILAASLQRITRLGKGRLRYWARTEFFKPSFVEENHRLPCSRCYSFKDIVALRTLEMLFSICARWQKSLVT